MKGSLKRGDDLPNEDVKDLVRRAQNGSVSAAGELYTTYHEKIYRFIWGRVYDSQLAEDLTGEVFTKMVISLPDYREMGLPFQAWLYRIARNLVIDYHRKNSNHQSVPLESVKEVQEDETSPEEKAQQTLTFEAVREALEHIEPTQREVVELRFLAGLPLKDVAETLDKTVASVKALQHRGLASLRDTLIR